MEAWIKFKIMPRSNYVVEYERRETARERASGRRSAHGMLACWMLVASKSRVESSRVESVESKISRRSRRRAPFDR